MGKGFRAENFTVRLSSQIHLSGCKMGNGKNESGVEGCGSRPGKKEEGLGSPWRWRVEDSPELCFQGRTAGTDFM